MSTTCPLAASGCNCPEGDCPGHCSVNNGLRDARSAAAAELRRLHKENADFRSTCDHLTRENAEQIGEIVALKEQRDDLLVALRIAVAAEAAVCNVKWVARHCRSVIDKATGEKS